MNLEEFINKYKPFNVAVYYNEYKVNCESINEYIDVDYREEDVLDRDECIRTGNVYELFVYPDNQVGFYRVICSKLEIAINVMSKVLDKVISQKEKGMIRYAKSKESKTN